MLSVKLRLGATGVPSARGTVPACAMRPSGRRAWARRCYLGSAEVGSVVTMQFSSSNSILSVAKRMRSVSRVSSASRAVALRLVGMRMMLVLEMPCALLIDSSKHAVSCVLLLITLSRSSERVRHSCSPRDTRMSCWSPQHASRFLGARSDSPTLWLRQERRRAWTP